MENVRKISFNLNSNYFIFFDRFIVTTFFLFFSIYSIDTTTIECIVRDIERDSFGVVKECKAFNVSSTEPDTKISNVKCAENFSRALSLSFNQSPLFYYLPKEITTHFSNLIILLITATGLKSITKEDLQQFEKLRGLYIYNSKLTTLDNDLFKYNARLERLSFYASQIHYVEADIFKPLQSLTYFSFGASICIEDSKKT